MSELDSAAPSGLSSRLPIYFVTKGAGDKTLLAIVKGQGQAPQDRLSLWRQVTKKETFSLRLFNTDRHEAASGEWYETPPIQLFVHVRPLTKLNSGTPGSLTTPLPSLNSRITVSPPLRWRCASTALTRLTRHEPRLRGLQGQDLRPQSRGEPRSGELELCHIQVRRWQHRCRAKGQPRSIIPRYPSRVHHSRSECGPQSVHGWFIEKKRVAGLRTA